MVSTLLREQGESLTSCAATLQSLPFRSVAKLASVRLGGLKQPHPYNEKRLFIYYTYT